MNETTVEPFGSTDTIGCKGMEEENNLIVKFCCRRVEYYNHVGNTCCQEKEKHRLNTPMQVISDSLLVRLPRLFNGWQKYEETRIKKSGRNKK